MEPVFCLLKCSLAASLNDFLEAGGRSVHQWLNQIDAQMVDFTDCPQQFINLNQAEDYRVVERHLDASCGPA